MHGVGGLIGALLTGVFADASINTLSKAGIGQVLIQAEGCLATILWSGVMTFLILMVCKFTTGSAGLRRGGTGGSRYGPARGSPARALIAQRITVNEGAGRRVRPFSFGA